MPNNITFIADPKVIAIPVKEDNTPMFDLKNQTEIAFGPSPEIPNNTDYTRMRKTVYEMLLQAQSLLPNGLKFCLYEGHRSITLQQQLFDERYQKVQRLYPNWPHEQLFVEATRLVSPVINLDGSANVPPHATGGAIDVYLLDLNNQYLDMGIHPRDWMEDLEGTLSQTNSSTISEKAKKNRQIMNQVLTEVGFANYPTEYWHWSYGDRYWAYITKRSTAIYDCIGT